MRSFAHARGSLVALALLSSTGCLAPEPSGREDAIVDGTAAAGTEDDAIVAVIGGGLCSGTLIGPRLVLTAKHCVVPEGAPGPVAARSVTVGTGPTITSLHTTVRVLEIVTTPGPLSISVGNPVTGATGTDVAFLILAEEFPGVTPIRVVRDAPDALVGTSAVAIGFGTTRISGAGRRMRVDATVTGVTPFLVEGIEVICEGDSGGPLLRVLPDGSREVFGVASFGVFSVVSGGPRCPAERDYWNRVDLHLDLLDQARLRSGECVAAGDESCNSLDDDCDGSLDEGCVALGGACTADRDCAFAPLPAEFAREGATSAACSGGVCVLPCDRRDPQDSCSSFEHPYGGATSLEGFFCAAGGAGGCEGECRLGGAGPSAFGTRCTTDTDCASLLCAEGWCASPCVGDALSCATGEVCTGAAGVCGGCAPSSVRPAGRARGESCDGSVECASGVCGRANVCSLACAVDRDCGAGMHCEDGQCELGGRSDAGMTCDVDGDCRWDGCGSRGGARFCGPRCSDAEPCSGASVCSAGVCAPPLGVLGEACTGDALCESGVCRDGLCTLACGIESACPIRTRCEREASGSYCRRPPSVAGGCSATTGEASRAGLGLLMMSLGLAIARRRRR